MTGIFFNHCVNSTVAFKRKYGISISIVAASWVLSVTASAYLRIVARQEPLTPFSWTQSYLFPGAVLYSINLFILQLIWVAYTYSSSLSSQDTTVGYHLVANNLLHVASVLSHACHLSDVAEIVAMLGFANICALYFWYTTRGRFFKMPAISGPLAWAIISFYWTEPSAMSMSVAFPPTFALCLVWAEFCCGTFGALHFRSYQVLLALGLLSAAIGRFNFIAQDDPKCWIPSLILVMGFYGKLMVLTTMEEENTQIMGSPYIENQPLYDFLAEKFEETPLVCDDKSYGAC